MRDKTSVAAIWAGCASPAASEYSGDLCGSRKPALGCACSRQGLLMPHHMKSRFVAGSVLVAALLLVACAEPDGLASRGSVPPGPTPPILPLDELLAQADAEAEGADPAAELAARAARLRARARELQNPAASPGT